MRIDTYANRCEHSIGESKGSTNPYINYPDIAKFEFPLPPIEEQKRIAEILWAADEVTTRYLDLAHKLDSLFKVTAAERFPSRSERNGRFVALGDLCARQPQSGLYKAADFVGRGVKIVKMGELFGHDLIDQGIQMDRMDLTPEEIKRYCLTSDDLLFGRRSIVLEGAGKCSMVGDLTEPTVFESSLLRITVDPTKALSRYVYSWFRSPEGTKEIRRIRSFTTVAGITGSDLKKVRVPLVPLQEQERIARSLFDHRAHIALLKRTNAKANTVRKVLDELLAGKDANV